MKDYQELEKAIYLWRSSTWPPSMRTTGKCPEIVFLVTSENTDILKRISLISVSSVCKLP